MDPDSGVRHGVEPDHSLRKHRDVDEGASKKGCLGMQLCPMFDDTRKYEDMELRLEVGMTVEILERGSHYYINQ